MATSKGKDPRFSRISKDQKRILRSLAKEGAQTTAQLSRVVFEGFDEFHAQSQKVARNTVRASMEKLEARGLVVIDEIPNTTERRNWKSGEAERGVFGVTKSYRLEKGIRQILEKSI